MFVMPRDFVAPALFALAVFARGLIMVVAVHWTVVSMAFLLGSDPDDNLQITKGLFLIVATMVTVIGIYTRRRVQGVVSRMAAGPRMIVGLRWVVISIGAASNLGGLLLLIRGHQQAGWWATGLGAAMVFIETAAALHVQLTRIND